MTEMAGGANLGTAQGKIVVDASDLQRLQVLTRQVGQIVNQNLGQISVGAKKAESSLKDVTGTIHNLLGAFGVATGGAAIVAQFTRMALDADRVATAYRRQSVAALSLAGSQRELTALLNEYNESTGNQIDKAQAIADVTRLQAVGFADSAKELEEFTIASRGISLAMGSTQDYVISQLQLAIANQSTLRLDQLGLGVSEVENRIKALRSANKDLTKEMAYQQAILGLAIEKYGALAKSTEAQATGAEKAGKAWKDLQLVFGEVAQSPIDQAMSLLARQLDLIAAAARSAAKDMNYLQSLANKQAPQNSWLMMLMLGGAQAAGLTPILTARAPSGSIQENVLQGQIRSQQNVLTKANEGLAFARQTGNDAEVTRMTGIVKQVTQELAQLKAQLMVASGAAARFGAGLDLDALNRMVPARGGATGRTFTTEQTDAINQWARDVADLERQAGTARLDATREYEGQRADAIRDYGQQTVREEQDFARNRARAIRDHNQQLADMAADAAKREADAEHSYVESVADVLEDAAKRQAKAQRDYNERVAELRADGNDRLTELEERYNKDREKAAQDHRDRLMSAAARLDAVGVFEEQRNYKRQQQDAKENYDEQRQKLKKALDEQLADLKENYDERNAESKEADAERLSDMREAFIRQRDEARQDAAQRLTDAQEAFAQRLADEDADRAVQAQRRAEDHAQQLAQLAQAQAERMAKIDEQTAKEKKALEEQFLEELSAEGLHSENWLKIQQARQDASIKLFNEWFDKIEERFAVQGPKTEKEAGATPQDEFAKTFQEIIRGVQAKPTGLATGGWVERTGLALVHQGEYMLNRQQASAMAGGMSRNITVGDIYVTPLPGMSEDTLAAAVRRELMAALEEAA